jgi:biotin carboxylase
MRIPFAVWHDRPLKKARCEIALAPFEESEAGAQKLREVLAGKGHFTHVIAGVERAVVAASYARQALGARPTDHDVMRRCHDKLLMKAHLAAARVPMTPYVDGNRVSAEEALVRFGSPLLVKERTNSGGRGIKLVATAAAAKTTVTRDRILERFIEAEEVSVESFVSGGRIVFENITEYITKKHANLVPAELSPERTEACLALHRRVIAGLGIERGMTHCEMYLAPEGPLFGEIAVRPPGGYIMELLSLAYDIDAWEVVVKAEVGCELALPKTPRCAAGAWILHPGAGRVVAIRGREEIEASQKILRCKMKIEPGQTVKLRNGTGDDVGYVLVRGESAMDVLSTLARVESTLVIDMARDPC